MSKFKKIVCSAFRPNTPNHYYHYIKDFGISDEHAKLLGWSPGFKQPHYISTDTKSIKCIKCSKHYCCDECAIEDDAIPGFLDQWDKFPREEKRNKILVTCLKCSGKTCEDFSVK